MNRTLIALSCLGLFACGDRLRSPTATSDAASQARTRTRAALPVVEIAPPCAAPAPLTRPSVAASGYFFIYRDGVDAAMMTAQLAQKYGFRVMYTFTGDPLPGFVAIVNDNTLAALRCEPAIARVQQGAAAVYPLP